MSFRRRTVLVILILLAMGYVSFFSVGALQTVPILKPLDTIPEHIGTWRSVEGRTLQGEVIEMLGVDEYLERLYLSPEQQILDLYVSYFTVLREGKQFHSPKNCLIGAGSTLIKTELVGIRPPGTSKTVQVNYMLLRKGNHHQLILYWYQCRGRIITSEYWEKIYRVIDAIFKRRSDGAFIRIVCYDQGAGLKQTLAAMQDFTAQVMPVINQSIPGR